MQVAYWWFSFQFAAGQPLGTTKQSECKNHIHLAFYKDGDYIDPTKYLEFVPVTMPEWKQECDDYKLVFKVIIEIVLHVYTYV